MSGVVECKSNDVDVGEVSDDIVRGVEVEEVREGRSGTSLSGTEPAPKS